MKFGIATGSNLGRRSPPTSLVSRGSLGLLLMVRWFGFRFSFGLFGSQRFSTGS
jgi:hypothetical protein